MHRVCNIRVLEYIFLKAKRLKKKIAIMKLNALASTPLPIFIYYIPKVLEDYVKNFEVSRYLYQD